MFSLKKCLFGSSAHLLIQFFVLFLYGGGDGLIMSDSMDSSPPGFSVHGILQARLLKWVAISFSICMVTDSNQVYHGDYFVMYENIKSLSYT